MAKRPSGLGRGLGALIPQKEKTATTETVDVAMISRTATQASSAGAVAKALQSPVAVKERETETKEDATAASATGPVTLPVTLIDTNPDQPRSVFGHRELEDLANSLREHGILQPIAVSPKADGRYELVAGERRFRAAKIVGMNDVPVVVRESNDEGERFVLALIENIQREDLNPLEEARAYSRLVREFGMTQEEVATQVGKGRSTVANAVRLLELPTEIQEALAAGAVAPGSVRALIGLEPARQMTLFRKLLGGATARDMESGARKAKGREASDPTAEAAAEEISAALGTKVAVKRKDGKGSVTVSFFSDEEFNALVRKLTA